jgi:hypothetical protein
MYVHRGTSMLATASRPSLRHGTGENRRQTKDEALDVRLRIVSILRLFYAFATLFSWSRVVLVTPLDEALELGFRVNQIGPVDREENILQYFLQNVVRLLLKFFAAYGN